MMVFAFNWAPFWVAVCRQDHMQPRLGRGCLLIRLLSLLATGFASIEEDVAVIGGVWACINHPVLFLIAMLIWLLPQIWNGVKKVFGLIINLFNRDNRTPGLNSSQ